MRDKIEGKKRLCPKVWKSLLFFMCLSLTAGFLVLHLMLPDTVRIIRGEEIPLYGGLMELQTEDGDALQPAEQGTTPPAEGRVQTEEAAYQTTEATIRLWGIPLKKVNLQVWEQREVIVSGETIGVDIFTDGVLVLGTGQLNTEKGEEEAPAKGCVFTGDRIDRVNGVAVKSAQQVMEAVEASRGETVTLSLRRDGESRDVSVTPVLTTDGSYKIGIWIRDRAQGIGTLTYYDQKSGGYGAVGHGITDVDTGEILPAGRGFLMGARVRNLVRGRKGEPGEVEASLTGQRRGDIRANTDKGVFGIADEGQIQGVSCPVAFRGQVKEGRAQVITDLVTGTPESFEVRVEKITTGIGGRSGLVVEITDERLLAATGGIIQGMSGCPLLQDGRLIGAVTHVFIKDPTRGYGIYIEDMLQEMMEQIG